MPIKFLASLKMTYDGEASQSPWLQFNLAMQKSNRVA